VLGRGLHSLLAVCTGCTTCADRRKPT